MSSSDKLNSFFNDRTNSLVAREWTEEEELCEQIFAKTTTRGENGKFVVRLPLKPNAQELGESKSMALDRLLKLEMRFARNPSLQHDYTAFMQAYLDLGHMEKVSEASLQRGQPVFYFPHHPVLKPDSSTTKLRTVFNGSATTSSGVSLNDNLMAGPCIQNELLHILLRFRCPTFVLTADIKKMFRQIEIHEDDRQLQLILWRFSPEDEVSTYCLKTVTYGTRSAPFAAARCLKQLALDYAHVYPKAAEVSTINDMHTDFCNKHSIIFDR